MTIGELHVCYSPSNCGDNYPTADGTANTRAAYYNVTGFPTVVFDGVNTTIGAGGTTSQLAASYLASIDWASQIPGNVSIVQSASLTSPNDVSATVNITSDVTGTYHALSYLVEYIGKNDSSGHDLGNVVRASLINRNVNLVTGGSLELQTSMPVGTGWNTSRLGVISFIQENGTQIVENANYAPVITLHAALAASPTSLIGGQTLNVTVTATDTLTGAPLGGATVSLGSSAGGQFTPMSGVTAADGTFTAAFVAPLVPIQTSDVISAQVSLTGYVANAPTTSVVVIPVGPPSTPTGVGLAPWNQKVQLSWNTVVVEGGGTVAYHVYRSTTATGGYTQLGVTLSTNFLDGGLQADQSYWYTIAAQSTTGFSQNCTPISASAVVGSAQGLPTAVGWWLSIDSVLLTASGSTDTLALHLPDGMYAYQYGAYSYGFVPNSLSGNVTVSGGTVQFTATFEPRYATLHGTIDPAGAATGAVVTVDGTPVTVTGTTFQVGQLVAGAHTVVVTSSGYQTSTKNVTLTPGNTSEVTVTLHQLPSSSPGGTGTTLGGLTGLEVMAIVVLTGAVALAAVAGVVLRSRRRRPPTRALPASDDEPAVEASPGLWGAGGAFGGRRRVPVVGGAPIPDASRGVRELEPNLGLGRGPPGDGRGAPTPVRGGRER